MINGFCRFKLVKDHPVGDLPAAPPAVSPLEHPFFGVCAGGSELRQKFLAENELDFGIIKLNTT